MKPGSKISEFLEGGGRAYFGASRPLSSKIAKVAAVLSLAGTVSMTYPAEEAHARHRDNVTIGILSGVAAGLALSTIRVVPVQPYQQQYYAPPPMPQYYQPPQYYPQYQFEQPGGRPGMWYCPAGPQNRCYFQGGKLERNEALDLTDVAVDDEPLPAPGMGG